jgi:hypothetical protein
VHLGRPREPAPLDWPGHDRGHSVIPAETTDIS